MSLVTRCTACGTVLRVLPAQLAALEYFDSRCLGFLREHADELASKGSSVPARPDDQVDLLAHHAKGFRRPGNQRLVGLAIHRWCAQAHPQGIPIQARRLGALGARRGVNGDFQNK